MDRYTYDPKPKEVHNAASDRNSLISSEGDSWSPKPRPIDVSRVRWASALIFAAVSSFVSEQEDGYTLTFLFEIDEKDECFRAWHHERHFPLPPGQQLRRDGTPITPDSYIGDKFQITDSSYDFSGFSEEINPLAVA